MGGLFDGIGDAVSGIAGGVGDVVGGAADMVGSNPMMALSLATMPFGGIGGLMAGAGEGFGAGMGLDMAMNGAEYGGDMIGGLGAGSMYDGMGGALMDADVAGGLIPDFGSNAAYSTALSGLDQTGLAKAVEAMGGNNVLQSLMGKLGNKLGSMSVQDLMKMGLLGAGAISGLSGKGGLPPWQPWSMPQAPGFLQANRSFDPSTKKFGNVQYSPMTPQQGGLSPTKMFAGGGLASIGGSRRPKYVSSHDKAVSALRSQYRSRKQAEADASIPGTVANRTLQGPGDPVLDEAFSFVKPASRFAEGGAVPDERWDRLRFSPKGERVVGGQFEQDAGSNTMSYEMAQRLNELMQGQEQRMDGGGRANPLDHPLRPKRMAQGGLTEGPGDGMSDSIPAAIDGQQPAAIATGEYIFPADAVSHLGNGSTDAGAKQLDSMVSRLRQARTGRNKQAPRINPNQFLK